MVVRFAADEEFSLLEGRTLVLTYQSSVESSTGASIAGVPRSLRSTICNGTARFFALPRADATLELGTDFGKPLLVLESGLRDSWRTCGQSGMRFAALQERLVEVVPVGAGFDIRSPYSIALDSEVAFEEAVSGPAICGEKELLESKRIAISFSGGEYFVPTEQLLKTSERTYELPLPVGTSEIVVNAIAGENKATGDYRMRATDSQTGARYETSIGHDGQWTFRVPAGRYRLDWMWGFDYCSRMARTDVQVTPAHAVLLELEPPQQRTRSGRIQSWSSIPLPLRPKELFVECDSAQILEDGTFELRYRSPLPGVGDIGLAGGRLLPSVVLLQEANDGQIMADLLWEDLCVSTFSVEPVLGGRIVAEIAPPEAHAESLFSHYSAIAQRGRTSGSRIEVVGHCEPPLAGWILEYAEGTRLFRGWFSCAGDDRPPIVETDGEWGVVYDASGVGSHADLYLRSGALGDWYSPYVLLCRIAAGQETRIWIPSVRRDFLALGPEAENLRVSLNGNRVVIAGRKTR